QPDVSQNGAQAVVGLGLIVLQSQGSLEFINRLQMPEVPGRPPKEKRAGDVPLGQIRIQIQRAATMKLGLLPPRARWIKFKVTSRADHRKCGVRQGKCWISSNRIAQVPSSFVQHRWIARRAEP